VIVENTFHGGKPVRLYKQSGAFESATYLNEGQKYELVFEYLKKYDKAFNYLDVENALMIGGAAYQYPKYYISHFTDKNLDVVEIDPMSTKIAKQYFFLDDLLNDYNDDRLGLYNDDGRVFLANSDKRYDAIFNDAFSGEVPVGTLATREAVELIKEHLVDNGVYFSNVLGAINSDKGRFLRSEVKTLQSVFSNVYVLPLFDNSNKNTFSNWIVIGTDNDSYRPSSAFDVNLEESDILLTDDYCPIDSLVKDYYHE
jgi:spermidine synthase